MQTAENHILFIAPTAYPLGGVAVWLDYLMAGLQKTENIQVTFGAVSGRYHDVQAYLEKYPFAKTERIDCGIGSSLSRANSIIDVIERVHPTMVVCANIPDVYLATRLLRSRSEVNYQLVATVHGLLPRLFADMIEYDDVIDHIVVTNQLTKAMMLDITAYSESQVHYAPYGVVTPNDITVEEISEPLNILYCGRIDQDQKRCQDLVPIAKFLNSSGLDYRLMIAGDGPYKEELLSKLGFGNIIYLGSIPSEKVSEVAYQNADVLLLTSDWETGPIVIWEALAHQLPVVTSRYNGVQSEASLTHNENCLMFNIGDAQAASEQLLRLKKPSLTDHLRNGGLDLIRSKYTRERSVQAWALVFQSISNMGRGRNVNSLKPVQFEKGGRLEKILGFSWAEHIRMWFDKPFLMSSAGDEWPHAHVDGGVDFNAQFAKRLRNIEASIDD